MKSDTYKKAARQPRIKSVSILQVKYKGKWQSFSIRDGRSDILRRQVNLDTGEIVSFLGKQLQGKRLKPTARAHLELSILARRCVLLPEIFVD